MQPLPAPTCADGGRADVNYSGERPEPKGVMETSLVCVVCGCLLNILLAWFLISFSYVSLLSLINLCISMFFFFCVLNGEFSPPLHG